MKWCEHLEFKEKFQKGHEGDRVWLYGKTWFFVGTCVRMHVKWNFCPICATPRPNHIGEVNKMVCNTKEHK